jgi:chromosome segregation ATPase
MSDLQHTLSELHRELAEARQLAPEERALLESAIGEIQQALERASAVETRDASAPGDALEGAAVRLEAEHPGVAGAVRALVDALAKAGI